MIKITVQVFENKEYKNTFELHTDIVPRLGEQICVWGQNGDSDAAPTYTVQRISNEFSIGELGSSLTLFVTPGIEEEPLITIHVNNLSKNDEFLIWQCSRVPVVGESIVPSENPKLKYVVEGVEWFFSLDDKTKLEPWLFVTEVEMI